MRQDVYSGRLKLYGEEHGVTIPSSQQLRGSFGDQDRLKEAKSLMRKTNSRGATRSRRES